MTDEIPVAVAQEIADRFGLKQVIIMTWDGETQRCVTYGASVVDADQAALGGDRIKQALGWPEQTMGHLPPRVQDIQLQLQEALGDACDALQDVLALQQQLHDLAQAAQRVVDDWDIDVPDYTPNVERLRDAIPKGLNLETTP